MATAFAYEVWLTDPTLVANLQAQYPTGIQIPPAQAASIYGAPIWPLQPDPNGPGQAPVTVIDWEGTPDLVVTNILTPFINTQTFTVPTGSFSQQTSPIQGYWVGSFWFKPAPAGNSNPTPQPQPVFLGARRWVIGFELPIDGESGNNTLYSYTNRDASRLPDGFGAALRSFAPTQQFTVNHNVNTISWSERMYVRIRALPSGEDNFWTTKGTVVGGSAAIMTITAAGAIRFYNKGNQAYPGQLLGSTSPLTVGTWYRIDLNLRYATGSGGNLIHGKVTLFLNGSAVFSASTTGADGLDAVQLTSQSNMGSDPSAPATHNLELDVDDWIGANNVGLNDSGGAPVTLGFPQNVGSAVRKIGGTGFGVGHNAAYSGAWQSTLGIPASGEDLSAGLTTVTPLSIAQIQTTWTPTGNYGIAGMVLNLTATAGTLNAGDTLTLFGVNRVGAVSTPLVYSIPNNTRLDQLPSATNPVYQWQRGNTVNTVTITKIVGAAEEIGNFGPEDGAPAMPNFGIHNAPYPTLIQHLPPVSGVQVASFVYGGNATALELALSAMPHWYFVRRVDNSGSGGWWFSSMIATHGLVAQGCVASIVQSINVPGSQPGSAPGGTLQATAHIGGSDVNSNANGALYQVVLVGDMGMRYMINGAFSHGSGIASAVNTMVDPTFTPEAAFFHIESPTTSASSGSWFKGVGHTSAQASPLNATVNANTVTFGAGSLTSQSPLHVANTSVAFSAWRRNDGSGATFFDLVTYTGNGAGGNRTIACALNGNSPLFAIVTPHNGASIYRDPSHTGTTSSTIPNTNITTGITGGDVNAILVGTSLNANAVVYDVFVIQSSSAVPGGWGVNNGTFFPVPTIPKASNGPFPAPPAPAPALDAGCISFATAVTELLYRLEDFGGVHWTVAECQRYLLEALRVWNAITNLARDRGTFTAASPNVFYDLPTVLPALRGYNLKDQDLMLDLQYQLEEPPNSSGWTGTVMFSQAQITAILQRRRDQFLWETGQVVTRETSTPTPDANGRVALPADIIDVRRAAWNSFPMLRDSEWGMNAYRRNWPTTVPASQVNPFAYSVAGSPPLTMQLAPPPTVSGTLDVISMVLGSALNPAVGVLLGVPDDFAWVTKWGAIRDLLSAPGPANDPARAKIADDMWTLGVTMAKVAGTVLDTRVNGVPVRNVGIGSADRYLRTWQAATPGPPTRCIIAGPNLVSFAPVPDAGPYTITMDVVRNQPVPVAFTDCFYEGGVAQTAALIDYAEFLARYKEGPEQAQQAQALLQRFLIATGVAQAMDQARAIAGRKPLLDEGRRGETQVPRQEPISPRTPVEEG